MPRLIGRKGRAICMTKAVREIHSALHRQFRGDLLRPGNSEYDGACGTWNGMVARRPGLIARCRDVADVQLAVRTAAAAETLTAIRCGGHSLAGFSTCEGGLVIDLSRMRGVSVDAQARRARFEGGCLLGNIDTATQKVGLAFPAGVVSHTGAAGLVLGGGTGWLNRLHGLSCDNVAGFTVVIADGSLVRADPKENADLFWALRGGGGNFGVVTEFEVNLHPVRSALLGEAVCTGDDVPDLLRRWRDFMPESPDNLRWSLSLRLAPDVGNVPTELCGRPAVTQAAVWVGDLKKGHD